MELFYIQAIASDGEIRVVQTQGFLYKEKVDLELLMEDEENIHKACTPDLSSLVCFGGYWIALTDLQFHHICSNCGLSPILVWLCCMRVVRPASPATFPTKGPLVFNRKADKHCTL